MAVPCPGCGREYDVALFAFGRTIWCTCGRRVGIEPRVRPDEGAAPERFAADAMLGRLARWLRLLGFDCSHSPELGGDDFVRRAVAEGRTMLTRNRHLAERWWVPGIHLVRSEAPRAQLEEVVDRFALADRIRPLSRCSECGCALTAVAASLVAGRVPPRVGRLHAEFAECPRCRRVYWEGSHAERIRAVIRELSEASPTP